MMFTGLARIKYTACAMLLSLSACDTATPTQAIAGDSEPLPKTIVQRVAQYAIVNLTADLSALSANQRQMIPLLIQAAEKMDQAFWRQTYGTSRRLKGEIGDLNTWRFAQINYGPWDRLANNEPFIGGFGPKPLGANFYPHDITRDEFESYLKSHPSQKENLTSLYTMVQRDGHGGFKAIPYRRFFKKEVSEAADLLEQAASLADDSGFRHYLLLRALALRTDDYRDSDRAWLDMKNNAIDIVIGPIETYEDQLFGYKASFEAYVLIKDRAWSKRLARYTKFLPALQRSLPVPDEYKRETPGTNSDLNAYDVIYYAGDCNAGSKTIAINLPNDETVQLEKGTRRLQLKNAMRAKYDKILLPINQLLIDPQQRKHVTFDAFFANTMFHEVAHGLGIKQTITGRGTVRQALREQASALEEGKADILGLHMITQLIEKGELAGNDIMDHYVTFLAGIFRSVRFGASSAHGRANMLRFNFFKKHGAFTRDSSTGTYRVNPKKMKEAVRLLSSVILRLQGDGDYERLSEWMREMGVIKPDLQRDLDRLDEAGIFVDVVFQQGLDVLRRNNSGL